MLAASQRDVKSSHKLGQEEPYEAESTSSETVVCAWDTCHASPSTKLQEQQRRDSLFRYTIGIFDAS